MLNASAVEPTLKLIVHRGRHYLQFQPTTLGESVGDQISDFHIDFCGDTKVSKERGQDPCENLESGACTGLRTVDGLAFLRQPAMAFNGACAHCIQNRIPLRSLANFHPIEDNG